MKPDYWIQIVCASCGDVISRSCVDESDLPVSAASEAAQHSETHGDEP